MYRLIVILITVLGLTNVSHAQVNIWEGTDVNENVELTPYIADGENTPAIIVCPGGSYFWHDMETEGKLVGEWLKENGISAFVLKYRTAGVPAFVTHYRYIVRGNRYPDAQEDLLQAIRYVRQSHEEYHVDTTNIGVMGFSAGGHLVMSSATYFPKSELPNFIVPVYPVVTMYSPYVHKRSRRALLGDNKRHNKQLMDSLSLERNIPDDCPPVFLVNCVDDPIVDYHNSVLLDSALTAHDIPHKYIQYKSGGHGFGASESKGSQECREWKKEFLNWFKTYK